MIVPRGVHSTTGISNEEAILHTYGSSNGPDCSLIKKGGGGRRKNPRSHLQLNRNNSFAFLSVPVDQLGDKCFFNSRPLQRREGRGEEEGGREEGG